MVMVIEWVFQKVWTCSSVATVILGLVALIGDRLVHQEILSLDIRAIVDNFTHGVIGVLTWHIVTAHLSDLTFTKRLCEIVLCGLIASAIDLDHFVAARSLRIKNARQLSSRPPLHCTSSTIAVCCIVLLCAHIIHWTSLHRLSWISIAAVLSHHLRDASRHGFWLYPFGSSPPVPYVGYIIGSMLLPHILPWFVCNTQVSHRPVPLQNIVTL